MTTPRRDRYLSFIARHDIAWELVMAALAVLYLAVGFAADNADAGSHPPLERAEAALTALFAADSPPGYSRHTTGAPTSAATGSISLP